MEGCSPGDRKFLSIQPGGRGAPHHPSHKGPPGSATQDSATQAPSPDRSNLKLRMVGRGEHRGTRVPGFPWSLPLAGFHLHTRWISNSFTSVSYQTGGSTFLRREWAVTQVPGGLAGKTGEERGCRPPTLMFSDPCPWGSGCPPSTRQDHPG